MTVEANSNPPMHQRRYGIGLGVVRALFTVVAMFSFQFGQELRAARYIFEALDALLFARVGERTGEDAVLARRECADEFVGKTQLAASAVVTAVVPITAAEFL